MSDAERHSDTATEAAAGMPGTFESAAHGHEPHQRTSELGAHPASQLEGYSRNEVFQVVPRDATGDDLVKCWYGIDDDHVVDLEVMR